MNPYEITLKHELNLMDYYTLNDETIEIIEYIDCDLIKIKKELKMQGSDSVIKVIRKIQTFIN